MASGNRKADATFDKGADGNIGNCKFQAGINGHCVDIGLLHILEQAAVLAVARIKLGTQSDAGGVPELVLGHAAHAKVVRETMPKDSPPIPHAYVADNMKPELASWTVSIGHVSRLGSHDGPPVRLAIAGMRGTHLCLGRHRQHKEEA